jgi:DNA polymerase II small subunit/DNA polymerase delta subunit B
VNYRNIFGVNAGCWQAATPYQIKLGHHPTPCILPVVNLQTGKLSVVHFDKEVSA